MSERLIYHSIVKRRLLPLLLFLALFSPQLRAADLNVFAAASLSDALREISTTYEKQSGDHLVFNFSASSTLARQIEQGAPADLIFSADEAKVDALEKKDLLLPGTRRSVLSNSLVVVVAAESPAPVQAVADLVKVKRLALGETQTVPAGIYAREYLEKTGLWVQLKDKVVPMENVRAALAAVESGNAEAGIVYRTDALVSKKVKVAVEIPAAEGPKISYPLATVRSTKQADAVHKLADFLAGPEAGAVFEKFGFTRAR